MPTLPTKADLQQFRTPTDLRQFVINTLQDISKDKGTIELSRLWKGASKELLREALPISHFSPWRWPNNDVLVCPKLGNQGFDAIVTDLTGKKTGGIEVSWAIDGKPHKEEMEELNRRGATSPKSYGDDDRSRSIERTIQAAREKAGKDYGGSIILIVFDVLPMFWVEEDADWELIMDMAGKMASFSYRASEVFLMLVQPDYVISKGRDFVIPIQ